MRTAARHVAYRGPRTSPKRSPGWIAVAVSVPGVLWFLLWFGINTGPGVLEVEPRGALATLHYLRTLGPIVALAWSVLYLLGRAAVHPHGVSSMPRVLWPWLLYGVISLLASSASPRPSYAALWALCYIAAFFVLWCFIQAPTARERLDRCRYLNFTSWAIALVLLVVLIYISRHVLLVTGSQGLSGYGVANRVKPLGGIGMVRASGFARFAAIPAIFAFVMACRSRSWRRLAWGGLALGGAAIVVLMQSRGAVLGLAAALAFAMLFLGRRSRAVGVLVLVVVAVALAAGIDFGLDSGGAMRHLSRDGGGGGGDLTSGRTRDWNIAWTQIQKSPLWGWGPQADRYFFRFHVHNTYLYAWLAAGALGVILFLIGMVAVWRSLVAGLRTGAAAVVGHHTTLVQLGCVLAFFTVRGIPEVSGALYGIDLLIMLPAMAWLGLLGEAAQETARAASAAAPSRGP